MLLLVAAGYSVRWHCENAIELGFLCAIAAVLTAYVRGFGGSAGLPQDFCGPMAKQQRMATLTFACILSAAEASLRFEHRFICSRSRLSLAAAWSRRYGGRNASGSI